MSDGLNGRKKQPVCSVIIPCWNDAIELERTLSRLSTMDHVAEIIVADASDNGVCRGLATAAGAKVVQLAKPSRGTQLNAGAQVARGEMLLFHHADTAIAPDHLESLAAAAARPEIVGGAFHRKFDDRHPQFRLLEKIARFLADRGGTLYGDQSIFVRREAFQRLGGFAEIPLMEDIEFSKRLRRAGPTVVLDPPISTSPRNHARDGALRTSMRNGIMIALYHLGFPPEKLHAWYYRKAQAADRRAAALARDGLGG